MRLVRLMALGLALLAVPQPASAGAWQPVTGTTWHIQFTGDIDTTNAADVYDVDMFDTTAQTVTDLHGDGHHVVCYVNAGAWERWRPDKAAFPRKVRGKALDGWPGERWLDVRRMDLLGPPLEARMDQCAAKGFDGIEFDNVDGYQNDTGFRIRRRHQIAFNEWLAAEALERGLAPGLKNALGIVDDLVDDFSFAINEQCLRFKECDRLLPFVDADKTVFHIEYRGDIDTICTKAPAGFSTIKKNRNLDAAVEECP
jgi:hypothetical protein